jgi:hypothetical protein
MYGTLEISVQNATDRVIEGASFRVALLCPSDLDASKIISSTGVTANDFVEKVTLPDGQTLNMFPDAYRMLPSTWMTTALRVSTANTEDKRYKGFDVEVRLFTEVGYKDFPFALTMRME